MGVPADVMRMLARHQWVREHGTPRVTVFVGSATRARRIWERWLGWTGRAARPLAASVETALVEVTTAPRQPVAVALTPNALARWSAAGADRSRALVMEGVIRLARPGSAGPRSNANALRSTIDAAPRGAARTAPIATGLIDSPRSLAELTLFEALEATPSTAGRFRLNQRVPVRFGGSDVEIDLLSRDDAIAIEVDGAHHFSDLASYRRDRRKDLVLQAHGLAVLRFLAEDVFADPDAVVRMVVEFLGSKLRRERAR